MALGGRFARGSLTRAPCFHMDVCRHDPGGLCHVMGWGIEKRKILLNELTILFSHYVSWKSAGEDIDHRFHHFLISEVAAVEHFVRLIDN